MSSSFPAFSAARRAWLATAMRATCVLALATVAPRLVYAAATEPAAPDGLTDDQAAQFLASLKDAVKSGDARAVAALVSFPLRVNRNGKSLRVKSVDAFVRDYATIFTAGVRQAVLAQQPGQLFRNWQGAMIGNGEVWFSGVCRDAQCKEVRVGVTAVRPGK